MEIVVYGDIIAVAVTFDGDEVSATRSACVDEYGIVIDESEGPGVALASYPKLLVVVVVSGSTACCIVELTSILVTVGTSISGVVEDKRELADDTDVTCDV